MIWELVWRWRVSLMASFVGIVAAALRFTSLAQPHALVFDEVFYVRGAYSLMTLGYEGDWTGDNDLFAQGDYSGLQTTGDFVVHPMVGKLLIQAGMELFGNNPYGWRFSTALFGTATAIIVAFIARHLLRSTIWGTVAGLFVAIDGMSIVLSRTGLLDNFLAFFATAGFGLVLVDRARTRRRLAAGAARERAELGLGPDDALPGWGPWMGPRWWRLAAMVTLALGASVKWSGLYFVAAFMALSVLFDFVDRRAAGYRAWMWGSLTRAVVTAVTAIVVTLAVYIATWWPWFATDGSYARHWAEEHPGEGATWLPDALNSLLHYHQQMWHFHTTLTSEHAYQSNPYFWLLQLRPTAFFFEDVPGASCGASRCVSAIHALGHPFIWWAATAALLYAVYRIVRRRDLLAFTVSLGVLAGWLPWLPYAYRTIFTFYSVAFAPFLVLTLVWALKHIAQPDRLEGAWSRSGGIAVAAYIGATLVVAGFFLPIWMGMPIPFTYWQMHMWLTPISGTSFKGWI